MGRILWVQSHRNYQSIVFIKNKFKYVLLIQKVVFYEKQICDYLCNVDYKPFTIYRGLFYHFKHSRSIFVFIELWDDD
jgi:hypothetical protein